VRQFGDIIEMNTSSIFKMTTNTNISLKLAASDTATDVLLPSSSLTIIPIDAATSIGAIEAS
jgi:hypothetical protein